MCFTIPVTKSIYARSVGLDVTGACINPKLPLREWTKWGWRYGGYITPEIVDRNSPGFPDESSLMNIVEATEFLSSNADDYFNNMISSYTNFLTFGIDTIQSYDDQGNGSCFFLRTPKTLLLVTAAHVFDEFKNAKSKDRNVKAFVGDYQFPLEERLISTGRKENDPSSVDIATFSMKEDELKLLSDKSAIEYWPPEPPIEGNGIAFAGFPGKEIRRTKEGIGYGYYIAAALAKRVTDRQIEIDLRHRDLSEHIVSERTPHPGYKVGGMSGGPVFTMAFKKESKIIFLILGGVIAEQSNLHSDTLFAERADFIRADGSIRRLAKSWR